MAIKHLEEWIRREPQSRVIFINAAIFPCFYSVIAASGLLLCLFLAVLLHYSIVTWNHCRVWEFWPSVSSTLGNRAPENIIWRCAIGLASGPRIAMAFLNYSWILKDLHFPSWRKAQVMLFLDLLRVVLAGCWTFVSSSEHWMFHAWSFIFYGVTSGFHMKVFNDLIFETKIANHEHVSPTLLKSYNIKRFLLQWQFWVSMVNIVIYLVPHYSYCAPGGNVLQRRNENLICLKWIVSLFFFCHQHILSMHSMSGPSVPAMFCMMQHRLWTSAFSLEFLELTKRNKKKRRRGELQSTGEKTSYCILVSCTFFSIQCVSVLCLTSKSLQFNVVFGNVD
jgi:hypothetical protein